jgi:hypothetical protein
MLCECACAGAHAHMRTFTHVTHAHAQARTRDHVHMYTCTHVHVRARAHEHTCTHAQMTRTHARAHARTRHALMHAINRRTTCNAPSSYNIPTPQHDDDRLTCLLHLAMFVAFPIAWPLAFLGQKKPPDLCGSVARCLFWKNGNSRIYSVAGSATAARV